MLDHDGILTSTGGCVHAGCLGQGPWVYFPRGMGVIFISHSSRDPEAANRVRSWLEAEGHEASAFAADDDDASGHAPLRDALCAAPERIAGVVVLVSQAWMASASCQRDFQLIQQLGKALFPVQVDEVGTASIPPAILNRKAFVDLTADDDEAGRARLFRALGEAGLRPEDFIWPPADEPERSPYRGLAVLESTDAAIYFGRAEPIVYGLDALRRMSEGRDARILAVVGRSGAGKSSFVRAGLISRLAREDERFTVLPVVSPGRDPLRGAHGLWSALGLEGDPASEEALRDSVNAAHPRPADAPSGHARVLVIDPADDLLALEPAVDLLRRIAAAVPDLVTVVTVSDHRIAGLDGFDRAPEVRVHTLRLPALSVEAFREVIERPARLNDPAFRVFADLSRPLTDDLAGPDGLPLLAFTVERLVQGRGRDGDLDLGDYQRGLGGITGAINAAVTTAYKVALRDPRCPTNRPALDALARSAFIPWLVEIEGADQPPKQRVAPLDSLPSAALPLMRHLADQRLVWIRDRDGVATVEVAHEAVLRNWWGLASWIRDERLVRDRLEQVKRAAEEWEVDERSRDLLVHLGDRLEAAESLLKRSDLARDLAGTPLEYLDACRAREIQQHERQIRRQRRRRVWRRFSTAMVFVLGTAAVAALAVAYRTLRQVERGRSMMLTAASGAALDAGQPERAMRFAVLAAKDTALSPAAAGAQFQLGRAVLSSQAAAILRGHDDAVVAAAYSPDGRSAITASADRTARVWTRDAERKWTVSTLLGHEGPVLSAAFSPDGARVITGSMDTTARVWSRSGRDWTGTALRAHLGPVHVARFMPDGKRVVTASREERMVRLWREGPDGGWRSERLETPQGGIETIAVATDGTAIFAGAIDGSGWLWSRSGDGPWRPVILSGHGARILSATFAPDGRRLVTTSADHTTRVWQLGRGGWRSDVLQGHAGPVRVAAFGAGTRRVATAGEDGVVRVWSRLGAGWRSARLEGHAAAVVSLRFADDGRLVCASEDGTARVWTPRDTRWTAAVLTGHDGAIRAAALSPDGRSLLTASDDGTARVWPVAPRTEPRWVGHTGWIDAMAYAPRGTFVVTGSRDRTARVWTPGEAEGTALEGHRAAVVAVAVASTGDRLATASKDQTARVWSGRVGGEWTFEALSGHQGPLTSVGFSPDGQRVVTGAEDGTARVWARASGGEWSAEPLAPHDGPVRGVAFGADDKTILTVSEGGRVRLWRRGPVAWQPRVVAEQTKAAAFAPGGEAFVTGGAEAKVWRLGPDGNLLTEPLSAPEGRAAIVQTVGMAGDGRAVVTSDAEGAVRVWERDRDGQWRPQTVRAVGSKVRFARFMPDGRRLLTVAEDATRLWRRDETGRWLFYTLGETRPVIAVAVSPDGGEVVTSATPRTGERPTARRWAVEWLQTDAERGADVGPDAAVQPLVNRVCAERLALTMTAAGGGRPRHPMAELDPTDLAVAPVLWATNMSVGDDVCRGTAIHPIDSVLSRLIPRPAWGLLDGW